MGTAKMIYFLITGSRSSIMLIEKLRQEAFQNELIHLSYGVMNKKFAHAWKFCHQNFFQESSRHVKNCSILLVVSPH